MMKITFLTLFPNVIKAYIDESIMQRALANNLVEFEVINFRDFTENKHKKVDDYPYGGGVGMLLAPQPIFDAIAYVKNKSIDPITVCALTPTGNQFNQATAKKMKEIKHLVLLCGHYEGFDQRILDVLVDLEISIGDYILTGGELGSLVIADATVRLLANTITKESHENDTFDVYGGMLEYPQYTRPANFRGYNVPDVLLSGHHKEIESWKYEKSIEITSKRRPELLLKK